ncbi:MAG: translation initiation factor IF-2 [Porphyromonadaceae bacterium CG2_30_38_12]|nr:MAG: translation initiation factor IF-2 [Porphyromonadaceae bacterium CG2_30_38_12]
MSIRLSKACKDLNVGISTAIEFLAKKGHKLNADPNLKLSEDEHLLLAKEFNKDMALKIESERLSNERHSKEKSASIALDGFKQEPKLVAKQPEVIKTVIAEDQKPHITSVGQIDLNALNKPFRKPTEITVEKAVEITVEKVQEKFQEKPIQEAPQAETPNIKDVPLIEVEKTIIDKPAQMQVETIETVKTVEPQLANESIEKPTDNTLLDTETKDSKPIIEVNDDIQEVQHIEQDNDKSNQEHKDNNQLDPNDQQQIPEVAKHIAPEIIEEVELKGAEEEIFSLNHPRLDKSPVVIGTIDLNLLNQSTRPKPKTKEQKRKEREDKNRESKVIAAPENKKPLQLKVASEVALSAEANKKKKRERFSNHKVDVTKVQQGGTAGGTSSGIKKPVPSNTPNQGANIAKPSKDKFKKPLKTAVNEEEVQKQIKETLARLASGNKKGKGAKYRRDKRDTDRVKQQEQAQKQRDEESVLKLTEFVTVSELAVMMDVTVNQVIATCMSIGMMVSINQRLDAETINIVADEFGFSTQYVSTDVVDAIGEEELDTEEDLLPRAPIVTVMGHVDHGKTSLLDYVRKTNVIAGEAGGITQHIGAYNVKLENGQRITFLDTPGHEAFTAMRARGAKVTDIAIIIVAADDNIMPQTIEAINHASAANVPMIFAINKVDKPGANPEKIKESLAAMNYLVEDWGGKYQSQDISAKFGKGVPELLEKVLLEAELLELKANPNRRAIGSVIESELDKGRGYISTILIQNGTLNQGDVVLAGTHYGKIKAMFNERNQRIKSAKPAEPVLILGLNGAPQAGDNFNVMTTEQEARDIANKREQLQREQSIRTKKHFTLDELGRRIALGDFKELNIIVKGDVDGSVEALSDSLLNLSTPNIQVNVIHKAVGAISDSDILLAAASNAIICGFQVRPTSTARKLADKEEIDIRLYSIIYDAIEEIKAAMEGMLSPEIKEEITATIEIIEVFKITKVGTIAGCLVRDGKVKRNNKVRIIRDGIVVYTGELDSLKRFKEDVKEVGANYECGLNIKNYNDIQVGDIVESYEETEVKKTL